jgi:hypothetical protein
LPSYQGVLLVGAGLLLSLATEEDLNISAEPFALCNYDRKCRRDKNK